MDLERKADFPCTHENVTIKSVQIWSNISEAFI